MMVRTTKKLSGDSEIVETEFSTRQWLAAKWRHEFAEEIRQTRARMTRDEITSDDAGIPMRGEI